MPFGLGCSEPLDYEGLDPGTKTFSINTGVLLESYLQGTSHLPYLPSTTPRPLHRPSALQLQTPGVLSALWSHLDTATKSALRLVAKEMRDAVDGNITSITSSQPAGSRLDPPIAVAQRWPHLRTVSLSTHAADCSDCQLITAINAGTIDKLQTLSLKLHGPALMSAFIAGFTSATLHHLRGLDLTRCPNITDLSVLARCTRLLTLHITGCAALTDLAPLAACTQLHTLTLTRCRRLQTITPVTACAELRHLNLSGCVSLLSLTPLSACTNLLSLDISACPNPHLAPLQPCTQLRRLTLGRRSPSSPPHNLHPLSHLPLLTHLDFSRDTTLPNLTFLSHSPHLRHLSLSGCRLIHDLTPLHTCPHLEHLDLSFCWNITALAPLSTCTLLHTLNLGGCGRVSDLAPLAACTALHTLDLSLCAAVTQVHPLATCARLRRLDLGGTAVQDLAPLAACKQLRHAAPQVAAGDEDSSDEEC